MDCMLQTPFRVERPVESGVLCTSGCNGPSVNLSQQSPKECVCMSGSKHLSSEHQEKTLHGSRENGPACMQHTYAAGKKLTV